jgi:hypothetical protein
MLLTWSAAAKTTKSRYFNFEKGFERQIEDNEKRTVAIHHTCRCHGLSNLLWPSGRVVLEVMHDDDD